MRFSSWLWFSPGPETENLIVLPLRSRGSSEGESSWEEGSNVAMRRGRAVLLWSPLVLTKNVFPSIVCAMQPSVQVESVGGGEGK